MGVAIKSLRAVEILDSRGHPTVSVRAVLEDGSIGFSSVPSGASTGEYEAIELRDGDKSVYSGKGVRIAVSNVNSIISNEIVGLDGYDQQLIDQVLLSLDGTPNKSRLGANALLGVSLAVAHAASSSNALELYEYLGPGREYRLPVPLVNIINGGAHANNSLDVQEFMIVPHAASCFSEAIRTSSEIFHELGVLLKDDGYNTGVGDEGGYAPRLETTELAFEFLIRAIERAGFQPGEQVSLALDIAASELLEDNGQQPFYFFKRSTGEKYCSSDMIALYHEWLRKFPIISIEDPLGENDWEGWKQLSAQLGSQIQLVGDDLFVTDAGRISRGVAEGVGNAVLIKPNQVGTLSETVSAIEVAREGMFAGVISHRSGETCDTTIADLAVATNLQQIKFGSMCRGERTAKYNRLLWIESMLGEKAEYCRPF
jgi:enolase